MRHATCDMRDNLKRSCRPIDRRKLGAPTGEFIAKVLLEDHFAVEAATQRRNLAVMLQLMRSSVWAVCLVANATTLRTTIALTNRCQNVCNTQHMTCTMRYEPMTCDMQHGTCSTRDMHHAPCTMQHATCNMQYDGFIPDRSQSLPAIAAQERECRRQFLCLLLPLGHSAIGSD